MSINGDSHQVLSQALMAASQGGMMGKPTATGVLRTIATGLGELDEFDQGIPILGAITDGLTLAAGAGSLIASAFDKPPSVKDIAKIAMPVVAQQIGA